MAQFATKDIRTLALVGHGAAGKTTLAEALLHKAGAIQAPGSVERGTTVSDFDPLEKTWQHSLRASVLHLETAGTRIHLIDTPGFPDFIGQAIGALDAVETAAVVVSASAGIEMITSRMMDWAAQAQALPAASSSTRSTPRTSTCPGCCARSRPRSAGNACRSTCPPTAASASSTASSIPSGDVRFLRRSPTRTARWSTRSSRSTRS